MNIKNTSNFKDFKWTIIFVIVVITIAMVLAYLNFLYLDKNIGSNFWHNFVDIHNPDNVISTDGTTIFCHCKVCGKILAKRPTANWWTLYNY